MSEYLRDYRHRESLEKYIDRVIRPPSEFVPRMKNAVNELVRYLHQMPNYKFGEVILSGSLGKGTTVEQTADADVVIFFNGYNDMESLVQDKPKILKDIEQYMCGLDPSLWSTFMNSIKVVRRTPYHLEFEIDVIYKGRNQPVNVDILPAMDVIKRHGGDMNSVYDEMKRGSPDIRDHYSVCFCKAQKELIEPIPAKLKDLIRLLKHWKNHNNVPMKSYFCEVLALYLYKEKLGSKTNFDMKTGFREALELLQNFDGNTLTIPSFYEVESWSMSFPEDAFIMDPVNPFSAVPAWDIPTIKEIAGSTIRAPDNVPASDIPRIKSIEGCTIRALDNVPDDGAEDMWIGIGIFAIVGVALMLSLLLSH